MTEKCDDGCAGDHKHKWEIEPHPDTSDYDVMVSDNDEEALEAIHRIVEHIFDDITEGEERVIRVRLNRLPSTVGDRPP